MEPANPTSNEPQQDSFQFSLWGLLVTVTLIAVIGAVYQAGMSAFYFILAAIFISGIGTFGYLIVQLLNAVYEQSGSQFHSLGKRIGRSILGMSIIFTFFSIGSMIYHSFRQETEHKLESRYLDLHEALLTGDMEQAYYLFTPDFRGRYTLDDFRNSLHTKALPRLQSSRSVNIIGDTASISPESTNSWWETSSDPRYSWIQQKGFWYYQPYEGD